jgi:hypothetical protein
MFFRANFFPFKLEKYLKKLGIDESTGFEATVLY